MPESVESMESVLLNRPINPDSSNGGHSPTSNVAYQDGIYPARSSGKPCWISLVLVYLTEKGVELSKIQKPSEFVRSILIPDKLAEVVPSFQFRDGADLPQLEEAVFNPEIVDRYHNLGYYFVRTREHERNARKILLEAFNYVAEEYPEGTIIPLIRRYADPCQRYGIPR